MIRHTGCNTALEISPSKATAFLDDYAFPISGLLDLYECGGEIFWLAWAIEQQDIQARTYLPIRFLLNRRLFHSQNPSVPVIGPKVTGEWQSIFWSVLSPNIICSSYELLYLGVQRLIGFVTWFSQSVFKMRLKDAAMAPCVYSEANCVDWYKPSEELEEMVAAVHASYETNKTVDPSDEEEMEFWE
ncbi:hypothetical protein LguiA_021213 [Lonicera macranthoides]